MAQISLSDLGIRALDENGEPVSGALCYVYDAGTTTPVTTYSDDELTTPNAFPVVANSSGTFPSIFVPVGEYKVDLTDADDASLSGFPRDNLTFGNLLDGVASADDARTVLDAQKQDDDLDDIAALSPNENDQLVYRNGAWMAAATPSSGFRNRLVNPLFQVDIEGNAAGVTTDGAHVVEGWVTAFSNGVTTQTTSRVAGDSVPYALQYAVTTGSDAAIAAGDYATIDTAMEGFDVSDALWGTANAKSIWVAGRIMAPTTGVYCVAVSNADKSRSYVFEVSCTAGSYVDFEEEIPGDTSGTWGATTGIGAILRVCIAGGATYQAAADAWQGGDFFATGNQANGLGANGNQLRIEALRYSVGAPMELEWRPYNIDLAKCKRYFVKGYGDTLRLFPIITGTSFQRRGNLFFPVEMRVPPAISNLLVGNIVSPSATNITTTHALITGASGADNECNIQGGGITMDARLI